jgi:hypothetical protein
MEKNDTQGDHVHLKAHPIRSGTATSLVTVLRAQQGLPRLMRVGLWLAALGAVIDISYHLVTDAPGMGHGPVAFAGHLITLLGMVVTMFGLFGAAFKRRPVEVKPTTKGQQP